MSKPNSRVARIGDQMQRDLSKLITQELKDPRLGMVTINGVKVSRDLSYADVYFTCMVFGDDVDAKNARTEQAVVLNNASGFLRTLLAKEVSLRVMPELRFHYDQVMETAQHLNSLINSALEQDRKSHPKSDGKA